MGYKESWNKIVEKENNLCGKSEEVVQNAWESFILPDYLNYDNVNIDSQHSIKMGSTRKRVDIAVKNEKNEKDLYIIELKKRDFHDEQEGQDQLFSYLKQIDDISIGILACDSLYVYDYHYGKSKEKQPFVKIPFEKDNMDGIKFVELFSKENYSENEIKEWVAKKDQERRDAINSKALFDKHVNEIKQKINDNLKKQLLEDYFVKNGFSKKEFEAAYTSQNATNPPVPSHRTRGNSKSEKFKNWMIQKKYSPSVVNSYVSGLNTIQKNQQTIKKDFDIWKASKKEIKQLIQDYDRGGKYQKIGDQGNRTKINALKRFAEFLA